MNPAPRIWLVGADGMLGRQLAGEFERRGIAFFSSDKETDIRCLRELERFSGGGPIEWIINCAAYTAVDRAEDEAEQAVAINADGVENLACLASRVGAALIHFSTDYVFAGDRREPYREEDEPHPLSQYGRSKREGELRLKAHCGSHFLFRISWLYGVHGPNFVHTMLKLFREKEAVRVVDDQFGSPTYAGALAANIADLVQSGSDRFGTYHYCDSGVISWFEFAVAIQELALASGMINRKIPVEPIPTRAYPTRAVRPLRSAMETGKVARELGFRIRPWRENLEDFFAETARLEGIRK